VLDSHSLTGTDVWPAGDVARGKDPRRARLQVFVHDEAAIDLQAGLLGQRERRPHPHPQGQEVRIELRTTAQHGFAAIEASDALSNVEDHAVGLVKPADEPPDLQPEHASERLLLWCDDVHADAAGAQGCGDFEADKAGADDDHLPCRPGPGDERPAVRESPKVEELGVGRTRDG
jgi:hypothetical protein